MEESNLGLPAMHDSTGERPRGSQETWAVPSGRTGRRSRLALIAATVVAMPLLAAEPTKSPSLASGKYDWGLHVALDDSGTLTGRFSSHSIGAMGTESRAQFNCRFSFYGFPTGRVEEYVIASWDPPVWSLDAKVTEGINTLGTLRVMAESVLVHFVEHPSGGCWNVEPFTQGSRFRLRETRPWKQVRVVNRATRLRTSLGSAFQRGPLLERGQLALVLEERDGWLLVEIEEIDPPPEDGQEFPASRPSGWLRPSALFPVSPPDAPHHSDWVRPFEPVG